MMESLYDIDSNFSKENPPGITPGGIVGRVKVIPKAISPVCLSTVPIRERMEKTGRVV